MVRQSRCDRDQRELYHTRSRTRPADVHLQGHFNKPKLPAPPGPDPSVLLEKVKKKMAIEAQENM